MLCGSSLNFLNFIESNKRACIISTQLDIYSQSEIYPVNTARYPGQESGCFQGPTATCLLLPHLPIAGTTTFQTPVSLVYELEPRSACSLVSQLLLSTDFVRSSYNGAWAGSHTHCRTVSAVFSMTVMWALGAVRNGNGALAHRYVSCAPVRPISAGHVLGPRSPASDSLHDHRQVRGTHLPGESQGFRSTQGRGAHGSL